MQMKIRRRKWGREAVGRGDGNEEMKTKEKKGDGRKVRREWRMEDRKEKIE
jgi:hypothetical protein